MWYLAVYVEVFAKMALVRKICWVLLGAALARASRADADLPTIANNHGSFVLGRTVKVLAPSSASAQEQVVVLETIDVFIGQVPSRVEVVVPREDVALSNRKYLGKGNRSSDGFDGPPADGLQVNDVAVWPLKQQDSSPRFVPFAKVYQNLAVCGRGAVDNPKGIIPPYDKTLPPALRYADMVAGKGIKGYIRYSRAGGSVQAALSLACLHMEYSPLHKQPDCVDPAVLKAWFDKRVAARWPKRDAADRLNLLAVRIAWEDRSAVPEFRRLYRD